MFSVYILYSERLNRFYIGTSDDVVKRLREHNSGKHDDAFTLKGIPWEIFFVIDKLSSKQAYTIEQHIKRMKSAKYIRDLNKYPEIAEKLRLRF